VKRWFADGNTDWVRVNGFGTRWWADDLDMFSGTSVGGVPSAIDGPTIGSSALKLIEASAVSVEFGMTGKICLTPDQCPAVNEGLSPSQDEISWAKEFFAEFERDGGEIRNGSDLPRIAVPPRSWIWRRRTASTPRSSATTRITRITCPRRRTPTTTDRLLTVAMEE
jgi:citrate lyase beta subunit